MEVLSILVLKAYPFFPAIPLGLVKVLPYTASFDLPKIGKNDLSQRNYKRSFTFLFYGRIWFRFLKHLSSLV